MRNLNQLTDKECNEIATIIGDGPFETPESTRTYSVSWCQVLAPNYRLSQPVVVYKFIRLYEYLKSIEVEPTYNY